MMNQVAKKIVHSNQLSAYKLPKAALELLKTLDKFKDYSQKAGKPPAFWRLGTDAMNKINSIVRDQSGGKFGASDVFYDGLRFVGEHESAPVFTLESQP
jgi:hypothetical protein